MSNKLIITICVSKDSYGAFSKNCEGIYAAGDTIDETKADVLNAIRLIQENLPEERWPEIIKSEYTIEWLYEE